MTSYEEYLNKAQKVSEQVIDKVSVRRIYERLRNRGYYRGNKKSSWLMAFGRKKYTSTVSNSPDDIHEINYYLSTFPRKRELQIVILQKLNGSTLFNGIFHNFEIIKRIKIDNEGDKVLREVCKDFIDSKCFELYDFARDLDFIEKWE